MMNSPVVVVVVAVAAAAAAVAVVAADCCTSPMWRAAAAVRSWERRPWTAPRTRYRIHRLRSSACVVETVQSEESQFIGIS